MLYIFDEDLPSYTLLAREAWGMCYERQYPTDTFWDRFGYLRLWRRLRRVALWENVAPRGLAVFLWQAGIRRYGLRIAVLVLAVTAWDDFRFAPFQDPGDWLAGVVYACLVSCFLGVLWATYLWTNLLDDLRFAAAYREARQKRQARLLSPGGDDGWKLERQADGSHTFRQLPPPDGAV